MGFFEVQFSSQGFFGDFAGNPREFLSIGFLPLFNQPRHLKSGVPPPPLPQLGLLSTDSYCVLAYRRIAHIII